MKRNGVVVSAAVVVLAGMAALAGCAPSLGAAFANVQTVPDQAAVVYIYRPSKFIGGGVGYDVKANGVVVTTLYNGGYYPYIAKPGEIEFSAKTEATSSVTLDVKAGSVYYVRGTVGVGFIVGRPHLEVVPPEVAEKEIIETKLIPEPK
ncbi:MAG: DUF2846 domain-containing protein [Candidatus Methylomirabilales bacterium]